MYILYQWTVLTLTWLLSGCAGWLYFFCSLSMLAGWFSHPRWSTSLDKKYPGKYVFLFLHDRHILWVLIRSASFEALLMSTHYIYVYHGEISFLMESHNQSILVNIWNSQLIHELPWLIFLIFWKVNCLILNALNLNITRHHSINIFSHLSLTKEL